MEPPWERQPKASLESIMSGIWTPQIARTTPGGSREFEGFGGQIQLLESLFFFLENRRRCIEVMHSWRSASSEIHL